MNADITRKRTRSPCLEVNATLPALRSSRDRGTFRSDVARGVRLISVLFFNYGSGLASPSYSATLVFVARGN